MKYEGLIYRPPSEFDSLIIQATIGCPHNKCSFCNMYSDRKFRIRPLDDIIEDLEQGRLDYGTSVEKIFFSDGNTVLMKTDDLLKLLHHCYKLFPNLKRVTIYGSAQYINLKTLDEFIKLQEAGLSRIHCGMESGDNDILKLMNKGFTREEMYKAGTLIKKANIELSLYYIVGLGGTYLYKNHAINSGKLINDINPDFIRLRTLIPFENTIVYDLCKKDKFEIINGHDALNETKLFVESLESITSYFLSDHVSNHCNANGKFPEDKNEILKELEISLSLDLSNFRNPKFGNL